MFKFFKLHFLLLTLFTCFSAANASNETPTYLDQNILQNFSQNEVLIEIKEGVDLSQLADSNLQLSQIFNAYGQPEIKKSFPFLDKYKWVKIMAEQNYLQPYDLRWKAHLAGQRGFLKVPNFHNYYVLRFPVQNPNLLNLLTSLNDVEGIVEAYPNLIGKFQSEIENYDETQQAQLMSLLRPWLNSNGFPVLAQHTQLTQINPNFVKMILEDLIATDIQKDLEEEMQANANEVVLNDPDRIYFPGLDNPLQRQNLCPSDVNGNPTCVQNQLFIRFYPSTTSAQKQAVYQMIGATQLSEIEIIDTYVVEFQNSLSIRQALETLENHPHIWYAEPHATGVFNEVVPNDTHFQWQWNLKNLGAFTTDFISSTLIDSSYDIDVTNAWEMSQGSSDIIVGVIDSGIHYTHPDFLRVALPAGNTDQQFIDSMNSSNVYFHEEEYVANQTNSGSTENDRNGNGFVGDYVGMSFILGVAGPSLVNDTCGHGTSVAGVIGAITDNGVGVAGVVPQTKILPVRISQCTTYGDMNTGNVLQAVDMIGGYIYLANLNARIVNISISLLGQSQSFSNIIQSYANTTLVFASAPNVNELQNIDSLDIHPATLSRTLSNVIAVGSYHMNSQGPILDNSNPTGPQTINIIAPGQNIPTTKSLTYDSHIEYRSVSGTSFATPTVAGIAALIAADNTNLTIAQLKECVLSGATSISEFTPYIQQGRIANANDSLLYCREHYGSTQEPSDPDEDECEESHAGGLLQSECTGQGYYWNTTDGGYCSCTQEVEGAADKAGDAGGFGCQISQNHNNSFGLFFLITIVGVVFTQLRFSFIKNQ